MPDSTALLFATTTQNVTLNVTSVTANQIGVAFHSPNGNQPSSFGNMLYIWQSGDQIPWQTDALASQAISVNTPDGSASFSNLNVTNNSYIIGYAVGPTESGKWSKYDNTAAQAFVPAIGGGSPTYESSSLVVTDIGSTSLVTSFTFLDGFDPQGSGAWAGIWVGPSVSYTSPPKWSSSASGNASSGTISFNNIVLNRGTTYTVGLYTTGFNNDPTKLKLSPLAYALSFTNA